VILRERVWGTAMFRLLFRAGSLVLLVASTSASLRFRERLQRHQREREPFNLRRAQTASYACL
jgi:hypothetical protein